MLLFFFSLWHLIHQWTTEWKILWKTGEKWNKNGTKIGHMTYTLGLIWNLSLPPFSKNHLFWIYLLYLFIVHWTKKVPCFEKKPETEVTGFHTLWINNSVTFVSVRSHKRCRDKEQLAFACNISQPFWLLLLPHKVSHFGVCSCQERAHLVRRACLGSCPCLHGEPELMVLKWRPDGDRGLIAAEGASVSRPLLLSSYFSWSCIPSVCFPLPPPSS